jgi:DNA-binding XRE family transcriptional regulator
MGDRGAVSMNDVQRRPTRLTRGRPRSFFEWNTLRTWGKLPPWEIDVPGFLLRTARQKAGLTQGMLAERLGISQQAVSRTEQWRSNPTVDLMRRWLAACDHRLELGIRSDISSRTER